MNILLFVLLIPGVTFAMNQQPSVPCVHTAHTVSQNFTAYTTSLKNKKLGLMKCIHNELHDSQTDEQLQEMLVRSKELEEEMRLLSNTGFMPRMAEHRQLYIDAARKRAMEAEKEGKKEEAPSCNFCHQFKDETKYDQHYIWRVSEAKRTVVMFNLNPYQPWHLLVIPFRHSESLEDLSSEEREDLFEQAAWCMKKSKELFMNAFEFYFNLAGTRGAAAGRCAGKSMDHVHGQLLARWPGDKWSALSYFIGAKILQQERNLNGLWPLIKAEKFEELAKIYKPYAELVDLYDRRTESQECYVCDFLITGKDETQNEINDKNNLVVHRDGKHVTKLLRYGWCGPHLGVFDLKHGEAFTKLSKAALGELATYVINAQSRLKEERQPEGINVVLTVGGAAGNKCPEHIYWQIAARFNGDTSAGAVIQQRPVMDQLQDRLRDNLAARFITYKTQEKIGNKND